MSLSLQQLANALQSEFRGDAELLITGDASTSRAQAGDLCFVQHERYLPDNVASDCSAVIVPHELE